MMRWKPLGLIFRPDPTKPWMRTHAALPVPYRIEDSLYRVLFASRDAQNRSHVGSFDIDLNQPGRLVRVSGEALLAPGPRGHFDEDGIYPSSVVQYGSKLRLFTIGFTSGAVRPMFYAAIGTAESRDGGRSFAKAGRAPIMARSEHDPCLVTSPVVLKEGGTWRMWYVSGLAWVETAKGLQSLYHIKYSESDNGFDWQRNGRVALDFAPGETNIARFWVLADRGRYHAWYCYNRGAGYRLGYADSADGLDWVRHDETVELARSAEGWDSDAQAYPAVVRHGGKLFMFYNGNGFGRDGIGLAVAVD